MPSAKILSEKQAYVADLKAKFESAVSGCVVAYGGINVENDTKLRKELRELLRLINDILDLSRLEADKVTLTPEDCDVVQWNPLIPRI